MLENFGYRLSFNIWVYCDVNSYGDECRTYCEPIDRNDVGHYGCNPDTGARYCLEGNTRYSLEGKTRYSLEGNTRT